VFFGDEVTFDEECAVDLGEFVNVDPEDFARQAGVHEVVAAVGEDGGALLGGGAVEEGEAGEVACEADARGDDHVAVGAVAAEPVCAALDGVW
jgi:hypothetical protein